MNRNNFDIERWTGRVLRIGVWISACLMLAGIIIAFIRPASVNIPSTDPSLDILISKICTTPLDPTVLMFSGLVLLMFTPILRVITAVIGFTVEKDRRFVFISSAVLIMLACEIIYSLFLKG